jgi:hypothetical protein
VFCLLDCLVIAPTDYQIPSGVRTYDRGQRIEFFGTLSRGDRLIVLADDG